MPPPPPVPSSPQPHVMPSPVTASTATSRNAGQATTIAKSRAAEAVKACRAAALAKGAHRRMHFQLGRALEFDERYEEAAYDIEIAANAGSSSE